MCVRQEGVHGVADGVEAAGVRAAFRLDPVALSCGDRPPGAARNGSGGYGRPGTEVPPGDRERPPAGWVAGVRRGPQSMIRGVGGTVWPDADLPPGPRLVPGG